MSIHDFFRFIIKRKIIPLADFLVKLLPKRVRVLLLISAADSLELRNVRFDTPINLKKKENCNSSTWLNIGLFPNDRSVIPSILVNGEWEMSEPKFVADNIHFGVDYVLFDVGANFGRFTLQLVELLKDKDAHHPLKKIYLFEPDITIVPFLQANIKQLELTEVDVVIVDKALGKEKGTATFYLDNDNKANNSLAERSMDRAIGGVTKIEVEVLASKDILNDFPVDDNKRIIYKSDLQGLDTDIASIIPLEFWELVDVMIIELWPVALRGKDFNTDDFKAVISCFDTVILEEFGKNRQIDVSEIDKILSTASDHQYFNLLCARNKYGKLSVQGSL